NYHREDLKKLPTGELHDKIKVGCDAHSIIENRRRERARAEGNATRDDNDRFPTLSSRLDNYKYPEGFKPVGITKYDAIEVAGGSNTTKEELRNVFIDNFQGAIARAGTRHDLSQCKQERNELLRSYTRRFFDIRAMIANILESDIIDCFHNGLTDQALFRDFCCNRPKIVAALRDMIQT
ncbi:retrotransposon protein, putative, Ty3-gypsy sub-class, partial [Panicum miliaceum]